MRSREAWWMVFILFGLSVMSWIDRVIISMLVTPIKADLGLSDFQMGMILGPSFGIAYAIAGLPMGWAADRYPRRLVIFAGAITWSVATIGCGFAKSFEWLLAARILVGVGEAALLPAAFSLIADAFPRDRLTFATAVFQMSAKLGIAVAYALGASILVFLAANSLRLPLGSPSQPWQLAMILVGLPGLFIAVLLFTVKEPPRASTHQVQQQRAGTAEVMSFLRANGRLMLLLVVAFATLSICAMGFTAWVPTYIERHFLLQPQQYGVALSLMNIISAIILVVNGKVVDKLFSAGMKDAHLRYYTWKIMILIPVLVGMFFMDNIYLFLAAYCFFAMVTAPLMVYVSALISLLAPGAMRGRLIAGYLFVFTLVGAGTGPALISALTDYVFRDEAKLGWSMALVCVVSLVVSLICMRMGLIYLTPAMRRNEEAQAL